jgi:hypothetical protein
MGIVRWFFFNWLAVIFAFLAGRELVSQKKSVETHDPKERISFLLSKEELSEDEEAELVDLSSQFEEEVLIIER